MNLPSYKYDPMKKIKDIGDISVYANDASVTVKVDNEVILCIPREGHGLNDLAKTLQTLSKDKNVVELKLV